MQDVGVDHVFPYRIRDYVQYRYVKEPWFRWMPERLFRAFERRFGWHLLVTATARELMRVAVVGLGKLGAPLAAVLASKGNEVLGIDVNPEAVRRLDEGCAPVEEPGLQELVSESTRPAQRDDGSSPPRRARDVSILLVPDAVRRARCVLERVSSSRRSRRSGAVSRGRDDRHVVVVASTVMPGSCDTVIRPALERRVGPPRRGDPRASATAPSSSPSGTSSATCSSPTWC